jgi:hypothetical protein
LSPRTSSLERVEHPTTRASISDSSTFLMCDVPSTAVLVENLLRFLVPSPDFL